MRCFRLVIAMLLVVVGCDGSAGSTVDATIADAGEPACPVSADGCNIVVGTIGGESLVVTAACPNFGAFNQRVRLTNYLVDSSCVATMAVGPDDRALDLEWLGIDPPTFNASRWYPTGPSGGVGGEATEGTAVMDVWDVASNRMRGAFDLHFGSDRVCGCFDAVAEVRSRSR